MPGASDRRYAHEYLAVVGAQGWIADQPVRDPLDGALIAGDVGQDSALGRGSNSVGGRTEGRQARGAPTVTGEPLAQPELGLASVEHVDVEFQIVIQLPAARRVGWHR